MTPPPLPPISNNVETKKIMVHTTLIRDSRGLGFSIAGGQGSQPFKVSSKFDQIMSCGSQNMRFSLCGREVGASFEGLFLTFSVSYRFFLHRAS